MRVKRQVGGRQVRCTHGEGGGEGGGGNGVGDDAVMVMLVVMV